MATNRIGEVLGNYILLKRVGQGNFAEVYLGEHRYLERPAAIKILHVSMSPATHEAFRHEAKLIAHLQHPHIVQVLDFGIQDQTPYLAMDYLANGTLRMKYPKGTRLSPEQIITSVKQIASALDYAHAHHIIHRDIKPENLLLTAKDEIVVSDFGIAVVQHTLASLSAHHWAGTPVYMAPEQVQGHSCPASDQYALAVMVYEWVCGAPPFPGPGVVALFGQHLYQPPPSICERVPELPQAVEDAIFGALAKDPGQRFACVQDFADVLEEAYLATQSLQTMPSQKSMLPGAVPRPFSLAASPPPPAQQAFPAPMTKPQTDTTSSFGQMSMLQDAATERSERGHLNHSPDTHNEKMQQEGKTVPSFSTWGKVQSSISRRKVLVGMAGIVGLGAGWKFLHPAVAAPTPHTPSPGEQIYTYHGHTIAAYMAVWSSDGTRIASCSADKTVKVWDAMTGDHSLTYPGHTNEVNAISWWSQQRLIASASRDKTVHVWGADTGIASLIYKGHQGIVNDVVWAPRGSRLASASYDRTVHVWDSITQTLYAKYTGHTDWVIELDWSPDGTYIASTSYDKTVQVWEAATGNHVLTYNGHGTRVGPVAWSHNGKYIASASTIDGAIHVWDANNGNLLFSYQGHANGVWSVEWSQDDQRIISCGIDHTVQIWDALKGTHVFSYKGHKDIVWSAYWSPDSKYIASTSSDATVQVWRTDRYDLERK